MILYHPHSRNILFLLIIAALVGCSKDKAPAAVQPDRTRIGYVMEDNFNYTICRAVLAFTNQSDRLKSDSVYTFLGPEDEAFLLLGLNLAPHPFFSDSWFNNVTQNMILPGKHSLRAMPLGDNQPLTTLSGNKVYVSRYRSGNDTITRVNGAKVSVTDIKAGNGLMQSLTEVVQPETQHDLMSMLQTDTSFTLFTQALQHSGLFSILKTGEYTLLIPHNEILRSKGTIQPGINLSSSVNILATDPVALAQLLKYHILPGKYFQDAIYRKATTSGDASVTSLHGEKIIIGGNIDTYNTITFRGKQNISPAGIFRFFSARNNFANLPAGNAVVHGINQVLIP